MRMRICRKQNVFQPAFLHGGRHARHLIHTMSTGVPAGAARLGGYVKAMKKLRDAMDNVIAEEHNIMNVAGRKLQRLVVR